MSDYTPDRWAQIKALKPQGAIFWDSSRNGTYNAGKNKAKREHREAKKART